jgi:hypothetical protein
VEGVVNTVGITAATVRKNSKILYSTVNGVRYSNQWQQLEELEIFLFFFFFCIM